MNHRSVSLPDPLTPTYALYDADGAALGAEQSRIAGRLPSRTPGLTARSDVASSARNTAYPDPIDSYRFQVNWLKSINCSEKLLAWDKPTDHRPPRTPAPKSRCNRKTIPLKKDRRETVPTGVSVRHD